MQIIFRKDKKTKDIVAFMPETLVHRYMIMSYMHIGQHSEVSLECAKKIGLEDDEN